MNVSTVAAKSLKALIKLGAAAAAVAGLAYGVLVFRAVFDIGTKPDPEYQKFHFVAQEPDGTRLIDERGHPLRFDSQADADTYARRYEADPPLP